MESSFLPREFRLNPLPRLHRPDSREDKTLRLMVKAALISQEHLKNLHTYKEKKKKIEAKNDKKIRVKKEEHNHDCKK